MKRLYAVLGLAIILSSCQSGFFATKHYQGRNYIKTEGTERPEANTMATVGGGHVACQNMKSLHEDKKGFLNRTKDVVRLKSHVTSRAADWKNILRAKKSIIKPNRSKPKDTKETPILNILGFSFAMVSIILFVIAAVYLLLSIAIPGLAITIGLPLLYACFALAGLGIILGAIGVGLNHPVKGLGITAIAVGAVFLLFGLLALLIYFAAL